MSVSHREKSHRIVEYKIYTEENKECFGDSLLNCNRFPYVTTHVAN